MKGKGEKNDVSDMTKHRSLSPMLRHCRGLIHPFWSMLNPTHHTHSPVHDASSQAASSVLVDEGPEQLPQARTRCLAHMQEHERTPLPLAEAGHVVSRVTCLVLVRCGLDLVLQHDVLLLDVVQPRFVPLPLKSMENVVISQEGHDERQQGKCAPSQWPDAAHPRRRARRLTEVL